MHKAKETPITDYLARPGDQDDARRIEDAAFVEEALARDAALQAGGPALEWEAFEAWVRSRLAERLAALPPGLLPGT